MNKNGLSLAMNVCSGNTPGIRGMPAAFFNRFCLESCQNVAEVNDKITQNSPLGSYHLSAADAASAQSFHFYQAMDNVSHVIRDWQANTSLLV